MRRTSFARIYSDDKNVAVFFGRPPRLSRTFCYFQLPQRPLLSEEGFDGCNSQDALNGSGQYSNAFSSRETITLATSIRWAALCALQKEKALELIHSTDPEGVKRDKAK